ncbi:jg4235, partial [Pararge aegeria aegeria]
RRRVELAQLATWFSLQTDADTTVCGLNCLDQLKDVTRVLEEGLRYEEKSVLRELQLRYFNRGTLHWDKVELQRYKARMAAMPHPQE